MSRVCNSACKVLSGAAVILALAGFLLLVTPGRAMAYTVPARTPCTDAGCGSCSVAANGDCVNTDNDVNGSCAGAGNGCPGCTCGQNSTYVACGCGK